jgi:UDP-glucose-4-epimerase GalE
MHFVDHIDPAESVADPDKYFRNNFQGSASLLQALRQAGLKRLVFSSTAAVYGIPQSVPITEDHPWVPIGPYDASKLKVERPIREEAAIHGLMVAILRYFNAAGADYRSGIGECHEPETHLIPRLLSAASGQFAGIVVNGTDYATPDGTGIRDYIHVSDLAEAHVLALQWLLSQGEAGVFNLGDGQGASVLQVIEAVARVTGRTIPVRFGARRAGDPPVLLSDIRRPSRDLRWKPKRSSLDELISDAWQWHLRRYHWPPHRQGHSFESNRHAGRPRSARTRRFRTPPRRKAPRTGG